MAKEKLIELFRTEEGILYKMVQTGSSRWESSPAGPTKVTPHEKVEVRAQLIDVGSIDSVSRKIKNPGRGDYAKAACPKNKDIDAYESLGSLFKKSHGNYYPTHIFKYYRVSNSP